jgi:hypothetical protein
MIYVFLKNATYFGNFGNENQVIHDVELLFGNRRTRIASHQYGGRVLKHHEDQQEEFEITGIVVCIFQRRKHIVVIFVVVRFCCGATMTIGTFKRIFCRRRRRRLGLFRHGKSIRLCFYSALAFLLLQ